MQIGMIYKQLKYINYLQMLLFKKKELVEMEMVGIL